ncbi:hypothetical protein LTR36_001888 [Oleoguttula mirabilis]|uniref:Phenol 2-monooxygenase n=1 Tax=Oleoguttula mirabilis TaxID=1507867 RepID=A0AAV9JMV2_9PEZI|nr:hypothetical protein LTR36_001888 [Oleoguttula mirabilis]
MPAPTVHMASHVDLLIIGAGPAGLMLAAWASQYNIHTRIIDEKSARVQTGQADGLHSRTLEIFDSFGLAETFLKDAFHVNEICSWNPDPQNPKNVIRTQRARSQPSNLSRYPQVSLNQGLTEQILLDYLATKGKVSVERNLTPETLHIDEHLCDDNEAYPSVLTLRRLADNERAKNIRPDSYQSAETETVRAKYVVGCDGAHSWLRQQLQIPLEGEHTNKHFGVMDIIPLTDFPDIRESCVIQSNCGSVMTIPREGRFIGQRVAPRFSHCDRIFLAGDAVHTHSPTMGQGMNVSMQDAYNLGWKLGSVLTGMSSRSILASYNAERRPIAQALIKLDTKMSNFYSDGPSEESQDYQTFRDSFSWFLSGVSVSYGPNMLVTSAGREGAATNGHLANGDASHAEHASGQHLSSNEANASTASNSYPVSDPTLAKEIRVGQRMPSEKIVCQAEANPVLLSNLLPSNGKWRVLVFAGDLAAASQRQAVQNLGHALAKTCQQYAGPGQGLHSTIEVLTIHAGSRDDVTMLDLHNVYHPWDDALGWDYWKVYSDDADTLGGRCAPAYAQYGVDAERGCLVIVRPDQHVSYIGPLEAPEAPARFFAHVLVSRTR